MSEARGESYLLPPAPGAAGRLVVSQDCRGVDHPGSGGNILHALQGIPAQQGGASLAKPVALDPVNLPVAGTAVQLVVRTITGNPRVQEPGTPAALETFLVPHPPFRENLKQQQWMLVGVVKVIEVGEVVVVGLSPDQRGRHNNCRRDSPDPQEPPDPALGPPWCGGRY